MIRLKKIIVFCIFIYAGFYLKAQHYIFEEFDSLFINVQNQSIFSDQKKFVDCKPKFSPEIILQKYNSLKRDEDFNLKQFVGDNFDTNLIDTSYIINHINYLWKYLTRKPDIVKEKSTLIPLPYSYIVPGGRFREVYYWDSYFTMLGLQVSGDIQLIENMIDNFTYLINNFNHIPNGNRTYYLSRSQPPFYSLMIELLANIKGDSVYKKYLPQLEKEYEFWMDGKEELTEASPFFKRAILLDKNEYLNRYWDDLSTPRPESYKYDVDVYLKSNRTEDIYQDIRAAAESGWDFSSRWFADDSLLTTIQTTKILPVDLNCLLYHLELTIAKSYSICNKNEKANHFNSLAKTRKSLMIKYFWNEEKGYFFDFNWKENKQSEKFNLAGLYPLFFNFSTNAQAKKVLNTIEKRFLKDGGLVTTEIKTGQQWDYPNGWAPLQWIGYKACKNYGYKDLAHLIAINWMNLNIKIFFETGKMLEKYDVVDINKPGGGGEYKLQDGFGWTNGVFLKLWDEEFSKINSF